MTVVALLAVGLMVPACKKEDEADGEDVEKQEQAQTDEGEAEDEAPTEAEDDEEEADEEQEEGAALDEETYLTVTYEMTCVEQELAGEFDEGELRTKLLGKHGVDESDYESADETYGEDEEVAEKLDKRLEECDEDMARELVGAAEDGDDGEGEEQADKGQTDDKPQKPKTPPIVGTASGSIGNTGGFKKAELRVTVTKNWKANGRFEGSREGKGFGISLTGSVSSSNNKLTLEGKDGSNTAKVTGRVKSDGVVADVKGKIFDRSYSVSIKATQ